MKLFLTLALFGAAVSAAAADSIQITAQCTGTPVQEAARTTIIEAGIKPLSDGGTEPLRATVHPGQPVTLELIRDFIYPTVLAFDQAPETPIAPKEFVNKHAGLTLTLTATRAGDQIVFNGTCTLRRPAAMTSAASTTPKDQPCVTSAAFITRECDFAGRTPVGVPAKIDLGEPGIDTGELTLSFANAK